MIKSRKILFILAIIVCCSLCVTGFIMQRNSEKKNVELKQQAEEETQIAIDNANKKIDSIVQEIEQLKNEYSQKQQRVQLMSMMNFTWSPEYSQLQVEMSNIYSQIESLNNEITQIQSMDYTVEYQPVKPISYLVFYYISALLFLVVIVLFIILRKKENSKAK